MRRTGSGPAFTCRVLQLISRLPFHSLECHNVLVSTLIEHCYAQTALPERKLSCATRAEFTFGVMTAFSAAWLLGRGSMLKHKRSAVAKMGNRFATIGMGRKWGGAPVGGWVPIGSPSNTMWPGPRPTSLPSGILIHPTIWSQLYECHTLLRVGIRLRSIFIPSLVIERFTGYVH